MAKSQIKKYKDRRGEHRARNEHDNGRKSYPTQGYKNDADLDHVMWLDLVALLDYFKKELK